MLRKFKLNHRKILSILFLIILLSGLIYIQPTEAHATTLWQKMKNLASDVVAITQLDNLVLVKLLELFLVYLTSIAITVVTYLTVFALDLNDALLSSDILKTGMAITTSLANLGFIFLLIIISIATILRRQSYGIKQLLAKLIIAALLVNFSFVIAGAILNFSSVFTRYFLSIMPGAGGGMSFANTIAIAFNPQAFTINFVNDPTLGNKVAVENNLLDIEFQLMADAFFSIFFSLAILIVITALALMLFIRYIYLFILLILMPLAWVTWIAPTTSSLWKEWWDKFIKWAFFPPILMMFLYIAFQTTHSLSTVNSAFSTQNTTFDSSVFVLIGDEIALIGLTIGGLFAAQKMSIVGATKAIETTKGIGNSFKNYTKNKARQGLSRAYNAMGGQHLNNALINSRIPGLNRLGTALNQATVGSNAKILDEQIKELDKAKLNPEQLAELVANKSAPIERRLAALSKLDSSNNLSALKQVPIENMYSLLKSAENFGQGELANKVDKQAFGMYKDREYANKLQELANELEKAKSDNDTNKAQKILDQMNTLIKDKMEKDGYSPQDIEKGFKEFFNGDSFGGMSSTQMQNIAQGISSVALDQNPKILSNIIKNSNIKDMKKITNNVIAASATRTGILSPNDVKEATVGSQMFRYDLIPALNHFDKDFENLHNILIKQGLKRLTNI